MLLIDIERLKGLSDLFLQIIKKNLTAESLLWFENKTALVKSEEKSLQLNLTFSHLPKQTGKTPIHTDAQEAKEIAELLPGFSIADWTIDRLCRIWLLMQINSSDKEAYLKKINGLFSAAEMNEEVALYAALPFYAYPEEWIARCANGIRSNIGTVLEAIMYHNPFPAYYFTEASWNQLVLKAFFTEKDMSKISGLHERVNTALADTLNDYVQERMAAHRTVAPEIYHLIELTNQKI
ncbi:EboA domain-containing protein [Pedobacter psychroterrae]|uniref:DNA alkylation repair enzyme n=1 Tax=Pedobacter psychroterrae TaxID=2530453 RepID=A0A4V2MLV6_9SPHI|nr:EboA domain-containing protein [Pedobacter psychroterrae]TCD03557.1 hypothetical protein EZ437_06250 [Pedobacter psychroterrae]